MTDNHTWNCGFLINPLFPCNCQIGSHWMISHVTDNPTVYATICHCDAGADHDRDNQPAADTGTQKAT